MGLLSESPLFSTRMSIITSLVVDKKESHTSNSGIIPTIPSVSSVWLRVMNIFVMYGIGCMLLRHSIIVCEFGHPISAPKFVHLSTTIEQHTSFGQRNVNTFIGAVSLLTYEPFYCLHITNVQIFYYFCEGWQTKIINTKSMIWSV